MLDPLGALFYCLLYHQLLLLCDLPAPGRDIVQMRRRMMTYHLICAVEISLRKDCTMLEVITD